MLQHHHQHFHLPLINVHGTPTSLCMISQMPTPQGSNLLSTSVLPTP
jgi:hypothetical protein